MVSARRSYEGGALDATYQYITERPSLEEEAEDVVYATDPEDVGDECVEDVPVPDSDPKPSGDCNGQTSLEDWSRWTA